MRKLITDIAFISSDDNILILIPKQNDFDLSDCTADIVNTDLVLASAEKDKELTLSISAKNASWINKIVMSNQFMIAEIEGDNIDNLGDCYRIELDE